MISSMAWTTWEAVITLPSVEMSTPEPVSLKRVCPLASTSRPRARITTTEGAARRNTSPTFCASTAAGHADRQRPKVRPTATARLGSCHCSCTPCSMGAMSPARAAVDFPCAWVWGGLPLRI